MQTQLINSSYTENYIFSSIFFHNFFPNAAFFLNCGETFDDTIWTFYTYFYTYQKDLYQIIKQKHTIKTKNVKTYEILTGTFHRTRLKYLCTPKWLTQKAEKDFWGSELFQLWRQRIRSDLNQTNSFCLSVTVLA